MSPSPSLLLARVVRWLGFVALATQIALTQQLRNLANWLEDERPLDHPLPWLAGLFLAVLLAWLVKDVFR